LVKDIFDPIPLCPPSPLGEGGISFKRGAKPPSFLMLSLNNESNLMGCLRGALAPLFLNLPPLLFKERGIKGVRLINNPLLRY
jgi:hypothetical protein